jgi:cytochrome c biogenesis factor
MFIGIVASTALETKTVVQLPQGNPVKVYGHELTFTGSENVDGKSIYSVHLQNGSTSANLKPVMYYSDYNQGTMREPDIEHYFGYDFYLSPMGIDNGMGADMSNGGGVNVVTLVKGQPTDLSDGTQLTLTGFSMNSSSHQAMEAGGSFGVGAVVNATNGGKTIRIVPELDFVNGKQKAVPAEAFGHMLVIMDMNVGMGGAGSAPSVRMIVHSGETAKAAVTPVLTAEIDRKPLIDFLWAGTVLLFIGLIISMYRRFTEESSSRKLSPVNLSENTSSSSAAVPSVAAVVNPQENMDPKNPAEKTEVENVKS